MNSYYVKEDKQCMYNVTPSCVHETIVAVVKQKVIYISM
jgi:hypothetical protein